ncbi:MAG: adenylate/guanylate cyclase domain-containing protein, partial [Rhodospirillales bacterium]|nr:adenylate/guanylate cyclase domain-containing protein [Rhodospirillales bacterium]
MQEAHALGPKAQHTSWSEPYFSPSLGKTIIVRRQSVWVGDRFDGLLLAAVDLVALSRYASDVSANIGQLVFILHGQEEVIAHPNLIERAFKLSEAKPMATIRDIGDRRLSQIWRADRRPVISQDKMRQSVGHYIFDDGAWQVFLYTQVDRYGPTPWLVGYHFESPTDSGEVGRFWQVLLTSVGVLAVFTLFGGWLGHRLARPFRLLTENAASIQRLDFDAITPMRRSRIVELDKAAKALDGMVAGLRVFERYVPKRLVERIVREGQQRIEAEDRTLTILFIDLVGFSRIAEHMTPQEAASFLNDHFARVGGCIDTHDGTIDKYIGDGLLAFWGAPEQQDDHADRACLAALRIQRSLEAANASREETGQPPIRARIGINTGRSIVGDIGCGEQGLHLALGEGLRKDAGRTGRPHDGLRAGGAVALHAQEAQELAERKRTQTDIYAEFATKCRELMAEYRGELGVSYSGILVVQPVLDAEGKGQPHDDGRRAADRSHGRAL